ncbi:MAG: B12-binding domain-containing radical SAM protein [Candidatus Nealsonbacteria bacterium]
MKKIVLVIPPQEKFTKDYLPSLGLGYIAACLERANYEVKIIDSHINNFDDEQATNKVLEEKPDAVGITANSHNRFHAISVCKLIKRKSNNQTFISVGGCHFSPTAVSLLETVPEIDAVIIGEGEKTFVDLLNNYFQNKSLDNVLGIVFRKNGKIIKTPHRPFIKNLDGLPRPAWHLFELEKYDAKLEGEDETKSIGIMSSRGCPNACSFCVNSIFWKRIFRRHSPRRFVDDVEFLHKKYGYRGFDFWDDTITTVRKHIKGICEEILKRKLDIVWYARARVNTVDREILALMRKAGCKVISFGVESGNPEILKNIRKNITIEQVRKTVKICVDLNYIIKLFFMYNLPGETLEDIQVTRDLMRELKFYGPNVHVIPGFTLIYPGTEIENIAKREGSLAHNFNWNSPIKFTTNEKIGVNPTIPLYEQKQLKSEEIKSFLESKKTQNMEVIKSIPLVFRGIRNLADFQYFLQKGINYVKKSIS